MGKKCVVLLSGGLDSSTILYIAKTDGYEIYALSFDYGQRHKIELEKARKISAAAGVKEHKTISVDLRAIGGSALTDNSIDVPKDGQSGEIPVTYVPARNLIFLSLGVSYAEKTGACDIFIGVNAMDYSGYPDCRPEFITSFENTANMATKYGVEQNNGFKIKTPLMALSKEDIIKTALKLGLDLSLTHSCYDPLENGSPCCRCDSCIIRMKGFDAAGIKDPLIDL